MTSNAVPEIFADRDYVAEVAKALDIPRELAERVADFVVQAIHDQEES